MPERSSLTLFERAFSRPERALALTFAGLIVIGTCLLSLSVAHAESRVTVLDALFTATSAVCVTGLIVVDTGKDYTLFGQCVILGLIQLGGLGIMTFAALMMQIIGQRLSFRSQVALQDVFYQKRAAQRFRGNLKWIVFMSLAVECLGAVLILANLPDDASLQRPAFVAVFHAVSAFCNAGFSTFSDSLVSLSDNLVLMTVIACLIVVGGVGYTVLFEIVGRGWNRICRRANPVVWSLNTRVVLTTSASLILIGAIALDVLGLHTHADSAGPRAGNAVFQSITARTAGFNTVDIAEVPLPALLWLCALMFVGGSPGSCAGGIKTTSLAIWVARLRARIRYREDVTIGGRRIPVNLVRRTGLLLGVAALYNLVGIQVLAITEESNAGFGLHDIMFEQISAFATVGLSTGLTPALSAFGKLWIIVTMFVGRLGPLTIALVVMDRKVANVRLPEETLMIG